MHFLSLVWSIVMPNNPGEFWALVGALAAIGLVVVAYKGLETLRLTQAGLELTRKEMATHATREARACAVARCEDFADKLLPQRELILNDMSAAKVPVFVKGGTSLSFEAVDAPTLAAATAWWHAIPFPLRRDSVKLLNSLEAWSAHFTNQLADEIVAFGPCAPQFCSLVVQMYAYLLLIRASNDSGKFPNVLMIFQSWMTRLEAEKRGVVTGNLLKQLAELQAKDTPIRRLPPPLGME